MVVGGLCADASARGAHDEAQLHQIRLDNVFDRHRVLAGRRRQRIKTYRTAVEFLHHRGQDRPVHTVKAEIVHVQQRQGFLRHLFGDYAVAAHLGIVAHALEQAP